MDDDKKNIKEPNNIEETNKFGFKDLIAVMIAQFQILMPIILGGIFIIFLFIFIIKICLKV